MENVVTISGSPAARTRSATKNSNVAPVTESDMEMVQIDIHGKLLAVALDPNVILPKPTKLVAGDYFQMDVDERAGSGGGTDSEAEAEAEVAPLDPCEADKSPGAAKEGDDNDNDSFVVVLPPKSLSADEIEAWQETVAILKTNPKMRVPPPLLKRKWTMAQASVWDVVKLAIKKEKRRLYQVSERKRKAAAMEAKSAAKKRTQVGHSEEPEFLAATASASRTPPPSQPAFSANERARLVHCLASDEFRPYVEIMLKGTQLRVDLDDKVGRIVPFREVARIFNDREMVFSNHFENHPNGDDDLRAIDPMSCTFTRTDAFLKGVCCLYLVDEIFC